MRIILVALAAWCWLTAQAQAQVQTITLYRTDSGGSPPPELWHIEAGVWSAVSLPALTPGEAFTAARLAGEASGPLFLVVGSSRRCVAYQRERTAWKELWSTRPEAGRPCDGTRLGYASRGGALYVAVVEPDGVHVARLAGGKHQALPVVPESTASAYPLLAVDATGGLAVVFRQFLNQGSRSLGERIAAYRQTTSGWQPLVTPISTPDGPELYPRGLVFDRGAGLWLGYAEIGGEPGRGAEVVRLGDGGWRALAGIPRSLTAGLVLAAAGDGVLWAAGIGRGEVTAGAGRVAGEVFVPLALPQQVVPKVHGRVALALDGAGVPVLALAVMGDSPPDASLSLLAPGGEGWRITAQKTTRRYLADLSLAVVGGDSYLSVE